jgi:hypothetical protein
MPKNVEPYVFPAELEPYRELIGNTGGNEIEKMLTRYYNENDLMRTNLPLACLAISVESQISLLLRLKENGKLK